MKKIMLFSILINLINCTNNKKVIKKDDETILFRTSKSNLIFELIIDNEFRYYDSLLDKKVPVGIPIGSYKKKTDSSTIYLRINNRDTTFKFALYEADSVLFGIRPNGKKFNIFTNRNYYAWGAD